MYIITACLLEILQKYTPHKKNISREPICLHSHYILLSNIVFMAHVARQQGTETIANSNIYFNK